MQDVICAKCGFIFRARAHAKDCLEAGFDQRLLEAAVGAHRQYVNEKEMEISERTNGKRTER